MRQKCHPIAPRTPDRRTQDQFLVQKESVCRGATKPTGDNCDPTAEACVAWSPAPCSDSRCRRSPRLGEEQPHLLQPNENPCAATEDPAQPRAGHRSLKEHIKEYSVFWFSVFRLVQPSQSEFKTFSSPPRETSPIQGTLV